MHVILRPTSHPELDPIVVTGSLFAIGRQEPPFNGFDGKMIAKLSRRHARLFEQDGSVYLADLGSLNGTTCNGDPVKHVPVALHTGDVIEFGGLSFEAEVTAREPEPERPTSAAAVQRLVLTPERYKETLEPIVVSSFPFLFDKNSELFARHKSELREVMAYMSRHHAHIFLRDNELFIEDLGSTNGTFVSGRKLDERARHLEDGDTIALGSDRLVYAVHLIRSAETGVTQVPSGIDAVDNPTRTIFVDSPTSFLDVYFVGDERGDAGANPAAENGADGQPNGRAPGSKPPLVVQLSRTFFGGPVLGPTTRRVIAGGLVVAGATAGVWYWQGQGQRRIEAAMAREDYAAAVRLAEQYLEEDPDSSIIRELATRAAIRLWVPRWMEQMAAENFAAASETMASAAAASADDPAAAAVAELLGWTTEVRAMLAEAPGNGNISVLMARARAVADQLDWWQADSFSHARTLDRIAEALPAFRDAREQVYSDVRQLRSEGLDYRPLIELDRRLTSAFAADDVEAAGRIVREFVEANPQFPDRASLAEDLARLERLIEHIAAHRWLDGYRQLEEEGFATAPFAEYADELGRRSLPDAAAIARLEESRQLWRDGELDEALVRLDAIGEGPWPDLGRPLAERYRTLLAGYRSLQESKGDPGYSESLFAYYSELKDSEDGYLLAELEQEFKDHADAAVQQALAYLAEAQAAWSSYQQSGGIQPEQRLQERVSADFSRLAGRLTRAVEGLRRCQRIHLQVRRPLPEAWASLEADVSREVAFQRGQLANLAFHEPEVRRRMLGLLPEPI